jgi:hypothetical protein
MKQQLWLRLQEYHFDDLVPSNLTDHVAALFGGPDPSTRAFASKLARKLGWSPEFAARAIEEYKKYVYLGVTSDFSVTPSKVIDQVWHEHLLFSRPYRQFCGDVLRQDFDHHPELVPAAEQTGQFRAQYEATLARYEEEFGVAPPPDIWCTPKFAAERRRGADSSSGDSGGGDSGDGDSGDASDSCDGGSDAGDGGGSGCSSSCGGE